MNNVVPIPMPDPVQRIYTVRIDTWILLYSYSSFGNVISDCCRVILAMLVSVPQSLSRCVVVLNVLGVELLELQPLTVKSAACRVNVTCNTCEVLPFTL
jgi:hypothetical protein